MGEARSVPLRRPKQAGLVVVDLRQEALRTVFYDVAAVVHFLRKVIWIVPGFTVDRYRDRLAELHGRIQTEGPFVAHAQRFLIEACKPKSWPSRRAVCDRPRPAWGPATGIEQ